MVYIRIFAEFCFIYNSIFLSFVNILVTYDILLNVASIRSVLPVHSTYGGTGNYYFSVLNLK